MKLLVVNIDKMQFAVVSGRGTTVAIFIVRQLQEKYITAANKNSISPSTTLRKPSIVCQGMSCDGPWGAWVWMNGLCMSSRACTTMSGAMCRSMVNTVRSLSWELVCIRAHPLAHCSSSWCWKRHCVSSTLVCHPVYADDLVPLRTPRRSVSPSSGMKDWHGK